MVFEVVPFFQLQFLESFAEVEMRLIQYILTIFIEESNVGINAISIMEGVQKVFLS